MNIELLNFLVRKSLIMYIEKRPFCCLQCDQLYNKQFFFGSLHVFTAMSLDCVLEVLPQGQNHTICTLASKCPSSELCENIDIHPESLHNVEKFGAQIVIELRKTDSVISKEHAVREEPLF
jgi:hypothetical protein